MYEHPRRILLAVTGLSPQIITETLYALAVDQPSPSVPTEIHLITTSEGADRARLSLLSTTPGWFHRLCADYQLPEIAFTTDHIHIVRDANGVPLSDIRSLQDNQLAADFITEQVRRFTADDRSALHVSIAGGRKTMGFFIGYALSLFGRPQDRLSHVLVSDPFENNPQFFYPTPNSHILYTRDNRPIDSAEAEVTLAEIPFVSLRHGLPEPLLRGQARFTDTVEAAQRSINPPRLALDLARCLVRTGHGNGNLTPASMAMLALFARRALQREDRLLAPTKEIPDRAWAQRYLAEYQRLSVRDNITTERALRHGMDGNYFSQRLSKLHSELSQIVGANHIAPYRINAPQGLGLGRTFGLRLAPEQITFIDSEH